MEEKRNNTRDVVLLMIKSLVTIASILMIPFLFIYSLFSLIDLEEYGQNIQHASIIFPFLIALCLIVLIPLLWMKKKRS